jgi:DNA-binding NarL/FixJ family response regulator
MPTMNDTPEPRRILVIEDDEAISGIIQTVVRRQAGYEIIGVSNNCAEGLASAHQQQPDVILLDITLPDGSGSQLIPELRRHDPNVVIVVMSGYDSDTASDSWIGSPPDAFIPKIRLVSQLLKTLDLAFDYQTTGCLAISA